MKSSSNALAFVFITLLIDIIGVGIIIPVLPSLIKDLTGGGLSEASEYGGWLLFAYSLMQFLFSPALGSLSDRYGRRPVLLLSLLGLGLDFIVMALAPNMTWLFIGRIIAGISGASFTTVSAYIADISTPENRAQNFGLIGVAWGIGFIVGPVIGGIFSQWGDRAPFYMAAGLSLVNVVYGFFVLPESLAPENRRAFNWLRANPLGTLKHIMRYPAISRLLVSLFLIFLASQSVQATWSFFTMEQFSWSEAQVGYSLGFAGLLIALVQGGLIRIIIPKIGEKRALMLGLALECLGLIMLAISNNPILLYVALIPYCLSAIAGPALQSMITGAVPDNEQGELQGGITSLVSLTAILGPIIFTKTFAWFTQSPDSVYFPGAPFILAAIMAFISLVLAYWALRKWNI